ncbi:VOC family protein [Photorhabdus aegyptia]|uniref:VOC family protein n=1 Tax=Photorhabdus aegyptia TaxID=2805098 RepID=UPI003B8A905C
MIITCIVEDVEPYYLKAQKLGFNIVEPPRDLPYGQRRLLIKDESGALLDISSPTALLDPNYR